MKFATVFFSLMLASAAAGECALSPRDRTFIDSALQMWTKVRTDALRLQGGPAPRYVFFDAKCVWSGVDAQGTAHGGTLTLPDGEAIPVSLMTFAGTYDTDRKPYLVMALEEIWRADARHRDNPKLGALMPVVFVHEMTHTVQAAAFGKRLDEIEAASKLELDDDLVQKRFESREGFREAYEKERDLLFAVAAEKDAMKRKALAREALRAVRARRAHHFTGAETVYAELEEVFLGMEGAAQWAAYRAALQSGATRDDAITLVRGSRKWWSQDEGLALFLAIEALMPDFPARVFGEAPMPAWRLFEEAVHSST